MGSNYMCECNHNNSVLFFVDRTTSAQNAKLGNSSPCFHSVWLTLEYMINVYFKIIDWGEICKNLTDIYWLSTISVNECYTTKNKYHVSGCTFTVFKRPPYTWLTNIKGKRVWAFQRGTIFCQEILILQGLIIFSWSHHLEI